MWFGGRKFYGVWYWMVHDLEIVQHMADFHWSNGEPDGVGHDEADGECLSLYGKDGLMNDVDCETKLEFACEREEDVIPDITNKIVVG
ncbi:hypothetical protein EB796_019404 [Bugula neritina]|uniref:C-type lectin domain-containing protein n=1 Tax=Bugula neritina TaxID=10212 RepID=A0A7J7J9M6_BUGNE|nr:hypothetical protein EB796_019404 [Bugula neritina]